LWLNSSKFQLDYKLDPHSPGVSLTGNLATLPAVNLDTMAPVVPTARDGEREFTMMCWGFPPPPNLGTVHAPLTKVYDLKSPYWRGWL
jgi:hypothetical protein